MDLKCVITADIKRSRKLSNTEREDVQAMIFNVIERIKTDFSDITFAIGMTTGDEFQTIINKPESCIDIYKYIKERLPVGCHFGIGYGTVSHLGKKLPSEMYGEAFYRSREAIDRAKKERDSDIVFIFGNEILDCALNVIFRLINVIKRKQTKRQKQLINFIEVRDSKNSVAASFFGISDQAVSKIIRSSGLESIKAAEELAKMLILKNLSP